jgi:hypothetical protein
MSSLLIELGGVRRNRQRAAVGGANRDRLRYGDIDTLSADGQTLAIAGDDRQRRVRHRLVLDRQLFDGGSHAREHQTLRPQASELHVSEEF